MLATHLLINDPGTPPDVLTWLGTHDLNPPDALTLATRPDYPAGAPLTVASTNDNSGVLTALEHPTLTPEHRAAFIHAANGGVLTLMIADHDCFTPDELTRIYRTAPLSPTRVRALAVNAHTPRRVAMELLALLAANRDRFTRANDILEDLLALTHHLPPTTPDARTAAATPDPLDTYAQLLANRGRTEHPDSSTWWRETLDRNAHPTFTTAALEHATTHHDVRGDIHNAIAGNPRNALPLRRASANAARRVQRTLVNTADPTTLHIGLLDDPTDAVLDAIAWDNPNVTAQNLCDLYAHTAAHPDEYDGYLTAIALHPRTPHDLRATATRTHPRPHPLATALTAAGTHPTAAALHVPWTDLHGDFPGDENIRHLNHWARQAWALTPHPAITLEYATALTALGSTQFPGTMLELSTTAEAIASSTTTTTSS